MRSVFRSHPYLSSAFALALLVTLFFAGRFAADVYYWSQHQDEPVAWMTIGYVGRSWDLPPRDIDARAGLPPPEKGHPFTLNEIAAQRGVPVQQIIILVEKTVGEMEAEKGRARGFRKMTEWLLGLVPSYGAWLVGLCTFLSCLAIPVPASILMLCAGSFISTGDLSLTATSAAAFAGAITGDQAIYAIGRTRGDAIFKRLEKHAAPLSRASNMLAKHGGVAVFASRWLVSALGPYVNFAAGAAALPWLTFTLFAVAGEMIWIGLYIGAGYYFTGNLAAASSAVLNILGLVAAGAVALGLGYWLYRVVRKDKGE